MKRTVLLLTLLLSAALPAEARNKTYVLRSPDERIAVAIECSPRVTFCVDFDSQRIISPSAVSLTLDDGRVWGEGSAVKRVARRTVDERIASPFYKKDSVGNRYNALRLEFRDGFAIEWRAYDDGAAYRFESLADEPLRIRAERAETVFADDWRCFVPYVRDRPRAKGSVEFDDQFMQSFENCYTECRLSELDAERLAFLPVAVQSPDGVTVVLTESDLESYPGMFVNRPEGTTAFKGVFAPVPRSVHAGGYDSMQGVVDSYEDYIADVPARKTFPWRTVSVADNAAAMADNDMVYRLASPCRLDDTSWIRPGKVSWDWWNSFGLTGVDFEAGINQRTYEYHIDFAARNGLEYILIDDGWTASHHDVMHSVGAIDLPALVEYGRARGVGIWLWIGYLPFEENMERLCEHYSRMGIAGFKIDFLDRDDQRMVDFTYRAAETAARNRMMIDFHGVYKPAGLQRTYPNVVNYEGVHGLENVKWTPVDERDQVVYDVTLPFIRQVAGPCDYTQGAMRNAVREHFHPVYDEPMSPGTRCRQMALYVVLESPLAMLCDSPSAYERESECTSFIASVPTVWNETRAVAGEVGEYIVMARRSGDVWFAGGMTDWSERDMKIDLSFLGEGDYDVELFCDGANARRRGSDFRRETFRLGQRRSLDVKMMPGGGFAAKFVKR